MFGWKWEWTRADAELFKGKLRHMLGLKFIKGVFEW
jgi:hypothetical protein